MRVHLPMTIQALPRANGPLPNVPLVPSDSVSLTSKAIAAKALELLRGKQTDNDNETDNLAKKQNRFTTLLV